jgi:hypothetical protein
MLNILSTSTATADFGGSLGFGGNYSGTTNSIDFATIAGRKQASMTSGGYLQFSTRDDAANMTEKMRITSTGNVGIGMVIPQFQLQTSSNVEIGTSLNTAYGGIGRYQNLLLQSEDFVTSWAAGGTITRTADTTAAPNGRTTADTLTATTAGAYDYSSTGIAVSGQTFTCSVWMRSSAGTQTVGMSVVSIGTDGGDGTQVSVDTTWRRYENTRTFGAQAGTAGIIIFPGGTGGTGTAIVWGAQCEQTVTVAGTYVRTVGGAVATSTTGLVIPDPSGTSILMGSVGIGVTNPTQKLDVNGRIRMATWTADGDAVAYQDTTTLAIALIASDRRLKKDIIPLTNTPNEALNMILMILMGLS